jgi:hypothetical protein
VGDSVETEATVIGSGDWTFRPDTTWPGLGGSWAVGDVPGVAIAGDRVLVLARATPSVVVLSRAGAPLATWGEAEFIHPHAVHVVGDDIWYVDDGSHTVDRYTLDGTRTMRMGVHGQSSGFHSGRPFARCTGVAVGNAGEIFVSDGYHNHRIHRFSPDGELLASWGRSGAQPGEFNFPHAIVADGSGYLYVADRENHRIQVFDEAGGLVRIIGGLHRPSALHLDAHRRVLFVGEIGPVMRFNRGAPNLGPRITVMTLTGEVLARLQSNTAAGVGPGQFLSPHALALDADGALYVAEVARTAWPQLFPDTPEPTRLRGLQRFVPLRAS